MVSCLARQIKKQVVEWIVNLLKLLSTSFYLLYLLVISFIFGYIPTALVRKMKQLNELDLLQTIGRLRLRNVSSALYCRLQTNIKE